jgi:peptide chain release factor 1
MDSLPDILPFKRRLDELDAQMADPSFYANARKATEISREQQKVAQMVADHRAYEKAVLELAEAQAFLKDPHGDPELKELAAGELPELTATIERLHGTVLAAMIPPEASDSRNTVMEIRAGTGGEEAALFAAELTRMYQRYAENRGWKIEPMGSSLSERGGYREISFLITGQDVYRQLKFESGVQRVQRVPLTEANGRIHTSTVTVAVLPEAEEVDFHLDPQDLEISVQRASGPGGQGVNTTDSAVRILHKPTGMMVYCADGRSQQIGTGGRSERIRTYNFPQSRMTDHRIGLTLYSLAQVMQGAIDPVIEALQRADFEEKFAALTGQPYVRTRAKDGDDD